MAQSRSSWVVDVRSFLFLSVDHTRGLGDKSAFRLWKPKQEPQRGWGFFGSLSSLQMGMFIDSAEFPFLVRLSRLTRAERMWSDAGINSPRALS